MPDGRGPSRVENAGSAWRADAAAYLSSSTDLHCILDARLRFRWAAGAWAEVVGTPPDELLGRSLEELLHPAEKLSLVEGLRRADGSPREYLGRVRCGPGVYRWLGWNGRSDDDGSRVIASARDVTARVEAQVSLYEELAAAREAATHDPLTGLANPVLLREHLVLTLARSARTKVPPLVLFVDLDSFKCVNDTLGHAAGDEALQIVAARLSEVFRPSDLVARVGGDELVIVLENANPAAVRARVTEAIGTPFEIDGHAIRLSASVGIALLSDPTVTPAQAIRSADAQMYMDKHRSRDGERGAQVLPSSD